MSTSVILGVGDASVVRLVGCAEHVANRAEAAMRTFMLNILVEDRER
jgi:hypothetical protein